MAEYTKIETARAIICDFCNQLYSDEPCEPADCDWLRMLEEDADVAPVVHGVWIPVYESEISGWNPEIAGIDPIDGYICSACKNEAVYDCNDKFVLSDYCPWCGARMGGDENG